MNTFESTTAASGPTVGLIELPELAELLSACGLQVVTGPDFRSAATAIRDAFKTAGEFPIITADVSAPSLRTWLTSIRQVTSVPVGIVRGDGAPVLDIEGAAELRGPFTVDTLLASVNQAPIGGAGGGVFYPYNQAAAPQEPADPFADPAPVRRRDMRPAAGEDPFAAEAPQDPAPVSRRAAREASAPAPQPVQEAPVSRRARRVQEAPEAAADAWDDSPSYQGAPAPRQAPPVYDPREDQAPAYAEPVQQQAPQQWEEPAAPAYAAPQEQWQQPAQAYAEPVQQQAPQQWEEPAAPAYAAPQEQWQQPAQAYAEPVQQQWEEPAVPAYAAPQEQWQQPAQAYAEPVQQQWAEQAAPQAPQQWQEPVQPQAPAYAAPQEQWQQAPGYPSQQQWPGAPAAAPGWDSPAPGQQPRQGFGQRQDPAEAFFNQTSPEAGPANGQQGALGMNGRADASGIFDAHEASKLAGTGRSAAGLGAFIINYSGKGGVGKSTTSLQLAKVASDAGMNVVLIDGNSGQGDLRTYLRLNRTDLPTIYDAAIGPVKNAVLTPTIINQNREENLGEVKFAFIAAPPDDINDPDVITHEVYRRVIEFARRNADLVIMDTQIIESADRTGVVTQLILPALVHDAWGVGIADMTNVGVNNLNNRLRKFLREEVPVDRLMVMINKVHPEQVEMASKAVQYFTGRATFLGSIEMDPGIHQDMNAGRISIQNKQMHRIMSQILYRVTGNDVFERNAEEQNAPVKGRGKAKARTEKTAKTPKAPKPAGNTSEKASIMDIIARLIPGKKGE